MAGSRVETKTLDRITAIAKTITGIGATRAYQGYKRFEDSDDFIQSVEGLTSEVQGFFACWISGFDRRPPEPQTLEIAAELVVYVPKDTTTDMNSAWELVMSLVDELMDASNYADGEMIPTRVPVELREIKTVRNGGVAFFDLGSGGVPYRSEHPW